LHYFLSYCGAGVALGLIWPSMISWLNQGRRNDSPARQISGTLMRFCVAWNLGIVFGQGLGGWLFPWGRSWPLTLAGLVALADLCLVLWVGGESARPEAADSPPSQPQALPRPDHAVFRRMGWTANLGGAFSLSVILHLFPALAVSLNVRPEHHGVILAWMRATVVGTFLLMHACHFWRYRLGPAVFFQGVAIIGLFVVVVARNAIGLAVGLTGPGLLAGYNYFASLYYSSGGSDDDRRGFACGMHEATLGFGISVGSLVGGALGELVSVRAPYVLTAAVIGALVVPQLLTYVRHVLPLRKAPSVAVAGAADGPSR
jgi:predicted MFS family arabinose efflux permease